VQILRSHVELTYGEQLDAVLLTVGPSGLASTFEAFVRGLRPESAFEM
jgi:hypothetical protein